MKGPIFIWIFPELLRDCRWQQTYLALLPIELFMKIHEMKWEMEREEAKQNLEIYFGVRSKIKGQLTNLRTSSYFHLNWVTADRMRVFCNLKWGPGYIRKDLRFFKSIKAESNYTQYDASIVVPTFGNNRLSIDDGDSFFSRRSAATNSNSRLPNPFPPAATNSNRLSNPSLSTAATNTYRLSIASSNPFYLF